MYFYFYSGHVGLRCFNRVHPSCPSSPNTDDSSLFQISTRLRWPNELGRVIEGTRFPGGKSTIRFHIRHQGPQTHLTLTHRLPLHPQKRRKTGPTNIMKSFSNGFCEPALYFSAPVEHRDTRRRCFDIFPNFFTLPIVRDKWNILKTLYWNYFITHNPLLDSWFIIWNLLNWQSSMSNRGGDLVAIKHVFVSFANKRVV